MKTKFDICWIYSAWEESNRTARDALMASALMSAEIETLNDIVYGKGNWE